MTLSVFGLGYVGVVTAACLASQGHRVIGVDVNQAKLETLRIGKSPIVEPEVDQLIEAATAEGRIEATGDYASAVANSELTLVAVGTPSRRNGSLNTEYLEIVARQIGESIAQLDRQHVIVFRSTILPGTTEDQLIPIVEKHSGRTRGKGFSIAYNPEFLRESTAVRDFFSPPKTVVGTDDEAAMLALRRLYGGLDAPYIETSIKVAETVKYVDNAFHALKITFANEVGRVCQSVGIDSHEVMNIFVQDHKLNISEAYLKPGFAFGGSCLPKDLRALNYFAKSRDVDTPLLASALISNQVHVQKAVERVLSFGFRRVGVAGFAFKANTDDLRESPVVALIETLIGKGLDVRVYDRSVSLARLIGVNKEYLEDHVPHISRMMVSSLDELVQHSEVIVIGNSDPEFRALPSTVDDSVVVYDLVRAIQDLPANGKYAGICW